MSDRLRRAVGVIPLAGPAARGYHLAYGPGVYREDHSRESPKWTSELHKVAGGAGAGAPDARRRSTFPPPSAGG